MKIKLINEGRCFCLYPPEGLKTVLILIFYEQRCREKLEVIQRGPFQISKASFIKQMHTFYTILKISNCGDLPQKVKQFLSSYWGDFRWRMNQ